MILSVPDQQRELVGACCGIAAAAGIHPAMTLAHARALLPSNRVHIAPLDLASVERAIHRLARRLVHFAPVTALDGTGGIWLDASGCGRLYDGIGRLVRRIYTWLRRLGFAARIAAAPTWGAAWAIARYGPCNTALVPTSELRTELGKLPIAALRVEADCIDRLALVGIERIEHLVKIPRAAIADRYGLALLHRLDQALGQASEPIKAIRPCEPVITERLFDGSTDRIEDIQLCIQMLVDQAAARLSRSELGCRRLDVTLFRSDLAPLPLIVTLSRPSRSAKHLWNLLRPKTEQAQLGFGVVEVRVHVKGIVQLPHEQSEAWPLDPSGQSLQAVGCLVDTLAARLGPKRVCRLTPVDSHWPERAFAFEAVERIDAGQTDDLPSLVDADRPSLLLPRPTRMKVALLLPDGPIATVQAADASLRVIASIGPERIEPEWWREDGVIRDYFKIQTEDGAWLWIFRESPSGQWFLHGEWA